MSNKDNSNTEANKLVSSEQADTKQQQTPQSKVAKEPNKPAKKADKKKSPFKVLFILIILAALAVAGYWLWQQWQTQQDSAQSTQQESPQNTQQSLQQERQAQLKISQELESQKQVIAKLQANQQQDSQTQQSGIAELQQQISGLQNELAASQRKFQMINSDQQQEWKLAEIQFLIQQAGQKLYFSDDLNSVVALLKAADQQTHSLADPQLRELRQALAQDIQSINSIARIDIDGVMLSLNALKQSVNELELASVQFETEPQAVAETKTEQEESTWQRFSGKVEQSLSKYYKVHHYKESVKPFISPNQGQKLRQNMLLNLQIAQLSALRKDQVNYQSALNELQAWTRQYFKQDTASSRAFSQQIEQLLVTNFSQSKPQTLQSSTLIKQIIQQRLSHWFKNEQSTPVEAASVQVATETIEPQEDKASIEDEVLESEEDEQEGDQ